MIVLGVDPGTLHTGWGVVQRAGSRVSYLAAGVIHTQKDAPLHERLLAIHDGLSNVIETHRPACMAVEDVFAKHVRSALTLGQARGVILLVGARAALEVHSYAPALVKRSIAGRGAAPKEQLGKIVCALLGLRDLPAADASDALAIAITHANSLSVRMGRGR